MCTSRRTTGLTLIETTLVIATMVLLVGLAVPAVRSLTHSFQTQSGVRSMVEAALNSARTMALSRQNYVGVRFEKLCTSTDPTNPLKNVATAPQYMIFIEHDARLAANGFKAVEGLEPIKLPDTMGVIDLTGISSDSDNTTGIGKLGQLSNATTFSIVFSPAGKVTVHAVRVRNREGVYQPKNDPASLKVSNDDVFNSVDNICTYKRGMFLQDDYPWIDGLGNMELGLGEENSRTGFVIYEIAELRGAYGSGTPWSSYLSGLATQTLYVSPYTGGLISSR
jgi:type II secretory pathway pseudopilin PulG